MKKFMLLLALTAAAPALRAEDKDDKKPKRELTVAEQRLCLALWVGILSRVAYKSWYNYTHPEQAALERLAFEAAEKAAKAATK